MLGIVKSAAKGYNTSNDSKMTLIFTINEVVMAVMDIKKKHKADMDTGFGQKDRQAVSKTLSVLLASLYTLQLKTQFYHWNVTGPHFTGLHALFEQQYNTIAPTVDEVAERIRALGVTSPGTFREFLALSDIKEDKALPDSWQQMVKNLLDAHESTIKTLRDNIERFQKLHDEASADMVIGLIQSHEKMAWMLRSYLEK